MTPLRVGKRANVLGGTSLTTPYFNWFIKVK
jgi:hypothetical protein